MARAQTVIWKLAGQSTAYLFYLRPTVYKDYLNFPGPSSTDLSPKPLPFVQVSISYCCIQNGAAGDEIAYESLWYRGSDAIGCRRYTDFHINPNKSLYVYVNSCAVAERGAVANALVRLYLDTILNCNRMNDIEVPAQSFWDLIVQLKKENFYTPDQLPATPPILNSLTLIDSGGDKQVVTFCGQ